MQANLSADRAPRRAVYDARRACSAARCPISPTDGERGSSYRINPISCSISNPGGLQASAHFIVSLLTNRIFFTITLLGERAGPTRPQCTINFIKVCNDPIQLILHTPFRNLCQSFILLVAGGGYGTLGGRGPISLNCPNPLYSCSYAIRTAAYLD